MNSSVSEPSSPPCTRGVRARSRLSPTGGMRVQERRACGWLKPGGRARILEVNGDGRLRRATTAVLGHEASSTEHGAQKPEEQAAAGADRA